MERGLTTILAFFVIVFMIVLVGKYKTMEIDLKKGGGKSEERRKIERTMDWLDYEEDLPIALKQMQARWDVVNDMTVAEIEEAPAEDLVLLNVALVTNLGWFVLEFYPDVAPNHTRNLLKLANETYYDNTLFHRIVPDFVIQGGRGAQEVGYALEAEINNRKNVRGTLGMARKLEDLDSASTQFYICLLDAPSLDKGGEHPQTVFGRVIFGMDVVDRIGQVPVGSRDRPKHPIKVWKAVLLKPKADAFDL